MSSSRIAVFASGNGTNAEEIFRYFNGHDSIEVVMLLSNDAGAFVLERAKKVNIPGRTFTRQQFRDGEVLDWLREFQVTHIVLAGFIWLVPPAILEAFRDKIINIHPALLPKFGGKGMYGIKVHEEVKRTGETETGITIHLVNENYDEGKVIFQARCKVGYVDTPADIARKVNQLEYANYPRVIQDWIQSSSEELPS